MKNFLKIVVVFSSLVQLTACGGSKEQTKAADKAEGAEKSPETGAAAGNAAPVQVETDGNTMIERVDINNDGKPDVFKFYRLADMSAPTPAPTEEGKDAKEAKVVKSAKRTLIRKEMDINFDQRLDIVEYYEGDAGKEQKVREELDLDFDGRVDSTNHYKDGNLTLVEQDLGFDGKVDTWKYFQMTTTDDGKPINRLVERRRDTNGDGVVDVWEYYTKGNLVKVGKDTNADGAPDQFVRVGEDGKK